MVVYFNLGDAKTLDRFCRAVCALTKPLCEVALKAVGPKNGYLFADILVRLREPRWNGTEVNTVR